MKKKKALATIRARRDALAARQAESMQQYEVLEQQLALLQRNIDGMHGGVQELDALIEALEGRNEDG